MHTHTPHTVGRTNAPLRRAQLSPISITHTRLEPTANAIQVCKIALETCSSTSPRRGSRCDNTTLDYVVLAARCVYEHLSVYVFEEKSTGYLPTTTGADNFPRFHKSVKPTECYNAHKKRRKSIERQTTHTHEPLETVVVAVPES